MFYPFNILLFSIPLVLCSTNPRLSTGEDSTALVPRQTSNVNLAVLRAQYQENDITSSGKYNMIFCNADGHGDTKARALKALLPMFEAQLDQLLLDAQLGTRSIHGYEALFKSRRNKKIVNSVFQKIRNADVVPLSAKRGAHLGGGTSAAPMFVCIEPGDERTAELLAHCNVGAAPGRSKTLFTIGEEAIFICPVFWNLPAGLHPYQCPTVVNNKITGSDELAASMYATILHEMVHLYYAKTNLRDETYNLPDCIDLGSKASTLNAQNFAYYASG